MGASRALPTLLVPFGVLSPMNTRSVGFNGFDPLHPQVSADMRRFCIISAGCWRWTPVHIRHRLPLLRVGEATDLFVAAGAGEDLVPQDVSALPTDAFLVWPLIN